jgi:hypothetical protein
MDTKNAQFQPKSLVWFMPGVSGGKIKGRITDLVWDDVFKCWNYEVKVTGAATYLYRKGSHAWASSRCFVARSAA